MVTTPPDLRVVLEAPATIPAAIALTICSIKAGSENEFDPATGATGGGILSPPYLIPQTLIRLPNRTTNHLEVSLTHPFKSTLMLHVYERRCPLRDPSLDHFHYENSYHFPELGWINPGSLPCPHHPATHFKII
jgi:hypothetical protein